MTAILLSLFSCKPREAQNTPPDEEQFIVQPESVLKWGINIDSLDITDGVIGRNELLSTILMRNGISSQTVHQVDQVSQETWSVRKIQAGKPYHILRDRDSVAVARYFVYDISKTDYVVYTLTDSIYSYIGSVPTDTALNYISGSIQSSLWNAMIERGADPDLAGMLSDVYSWTIDFFGIQRNDSFCVYYEDVYADSVRVTTGNILACNFIT